MSNPYNPKDPARPEYFGGREHILKNAHEQIAIAHDHRTSGGILIYGHRGVGKTSLVKKIISEISGTEEKPSGTIIIYRRLGRTTNDQELYQILTEDLEQQVEKRRSIIEKLKSSAQSVEGVKAFQLGFTRNVTDLKQSPYYRWRAHVESLKNASIVFIAIDDADFLSLEAIGELKTIVEAMSATPILLTITGGVEFEERLVDKYSPVARIFSGASFNIGRFTLEETREVLCKPLAREQTRWEEAAIGTLQKVTGGYPYLVQCLASASYVENVVITASRVNEQIGEAVRIGRSWLDHEVPDASDQDVVSFARIACCRSAISLLISSSERYAPWMRFGFESSADWKSRSPPPKSFSAPDESRMVRESIWLAT